MNLLMMPFLHVGQGTNLGGLSVFPIWTDAPVVSGLDTGTAARVQVDEREGSPVVEELVASVSCVEHGRWHGATAQVRRARRASMMVRSAQTVADQDERQSQV